MILRARSILGIQLQPATTYPILHLAVPDRVMYAIACSGISLFKDSHDLIFIPGPLAAAKASSPMKKSRSSVPLLADSAPPCPVPPVRKEGLFAIAGRPDPEPPDPPAAPLVAIAVGNTKEGESLPAKPSKCQVCVL